MNYRPAMFSWSAAALAMGAVAALTTLAAPVRGESQPPDADATVLHLQEQAERLVKRDRLDAVLRADATDADAAKLQAEINRRMTAALERAKTVAGVTVSTGSYSVYQERPDPQKPPRWHGSETLSLVGSDPAPLLALAGTLQQDGLVFSSLAFELTPEAARSVEDELTGVALARLKARAERIAAALGLAVERIRDLRVGNANGAPPQPRALLAEKAMVAPPPVAEAGDAVVAVSVTADIVLGRRP